jgi:hypothetical protein
VLALCHFKPLNHWANLTKLGKKVKVLPSISSYFLIPPVTNNNMTDMWTCEAELLRVSLAAGP